MTAKGSTLDGFELARADRQFVPATTELRDNSVLVTSPRVRNPVPVR